MNLALSDEQVFLREAARGALSRFKTLEAARAALDTPQGGIPHDGAHPEGHKQASGSGSALPDLWPAACEAGWPGLLIDEGHGGAGLTRSTRCSCSASAGACWRAVALLGHLPATAILDASPSAAEFLLEPLATGERRAAYLPALPPDDLMDGWCVDPAHGSARPSAARRRTRKAGCSSAGGSLSCRMPPAPTCSSAWRSRTHGHDGAPSASRSRAPRACPSRRYCYDATRSLGHVTL